MIHPLPSGTRDVLPDEMRELRAITEALRGVFDRFGYGEVSTPAIEYEQVLSRAGGGPQPAYRVFDDHGEVLALRPDMTVPIARVAATRYGSAEPPLRFCYVAHAYRAVRPHRGQMREFLQAGIELFGAPGPAGTAEALAVLCAGLDAVGLRPPASAWARPRCTRRSWTRTGSRRPPGRGCWRSSATRASWRWRRRSARSTCPRPRPRSSCASRSCAAAPRCSSA